MLIECKCGHGMVWDIDNEKSCKFSNCKCRKLDPSRIAINGIEWVPSSLLKGGN